MESVLCKKDCDNIITIKTQKNAVHTGYKTPIKGETRTLHKNPIGDKNKGINKKHKNVLANGYEMIDGKKVLCNTKELRSKFREQKIHNERMGTSKTIIDNGKTIRCNTKKLREKYKDYENIQKGEKHAKDCSREIGGGTNRLERYRIPAKLVEHIFNKLS